MSADRHVIVLVPSRILCDETVIAHGKQAGLAEDGVDERVLWLGRLPSKSGEMKSIGVFADQLEERVTEKLEALSSRLKDAEIMLRGCEMKIHNDKVRSTELESILPFSAAWWSSWTKPERDNAVPTTATWLADSPAYLPFLNDVHEVKRQLKDRMMLLMSKVVKKRPPKHAEFLSKVKCIVATTDAFLKWKAGQTKGMIGRTVAKVAARSEGALVDEVGALDVLPAIAALNDHLKTCIFVGDENQTLLNQRQGQSPEQFPLASGRAHGAASKNRKVSKSDDVKNEVQLVDEEEELRVNNLMLRGMSDWFDKGNGNIEHLSALTHCKRCSPAIQVSQVSADAHETTAFPVPVQQHGTSNNAASHNIFWLRVVDWAQLCDYEKIVEAQRQAGASKLWKISFCATTTCPKQQVVWHEVLCRALLVHVEWDPQEMHAGERMLIICFLCCVSEPVTALLHSCLKRTRSVWMWFSLAFLRVKRVENATEPVQSRYHRSGCFLTGHNPIYLFHYP